MSGRSKALMLGLLLALLVLLGCVSLQPTRERSESLVPSEMAPASQKAYLDLVARAYQADPTLDLATTLGPGWTREELDDLLHTMLAETSESNTDRVARLQNLAHALDTLPLSAEDGGSNGDAKVTFLIVLAALVILTAAILLVRAASRSRTAPPSKRTVERLVQKLSTTPAEPIADTYKHLVEPTDWPGEHEKPLLQFTTTYTMPDDLYDPSVSIETKSGHFLGECGVSVCQTRGSERPKQVTAFEVWLFDKNDIRTASQVLVGDAGSDPTLQAAASEKGEPIIASPGETFSLETATLRLRIRVVESTYRQIERQQNSVFQKLTLEAAAWPLETSRDTGGWGWSHLGA